MIYDKNFRKKSFPIILLLCILSNKATSLSLHSPSRYSLKPFRVQNLHHQKRWTPLCEKGPNLDVDAGKYDVANEVCDDNINSTQSLQLIEGQSTSASNHSQTPPTSSETASNSTKQPNSWFNQFFQSKKITFERKAKQAKNYTKHVKEHKKKKEISEETIMKTSNDESQNMNLTLSPLKSNLESKVNTSATSLNQSTKTIFSLAKQKSSSQISSGIVAQKLKSLSQNDFKFNEKNNQTSKRKDTTAPLLSSLDPNATLTVADLEIILRNNNFLRSSDLKDIDLSSSTKTGTKSSSSSSTSSKNQAGVAFPQPSIVTAKEIATFALITTGLMGMTLGISMSSNLWFVGFVLGALYGQKVAKENDGNPSNIPLSAIILSTSKQVAKGYLTVSDAIKGIWFMYKTGQLSYEYYKTYAALDKKFEIQNKVDAWNDRFQEGKRNFDKWEKENEVGRKILAGLRTAWLVEEKSFKKASKRSKYKALVGKSKYRIVNYANELKSFVFNLLRAVWNTLTRAPGHERDLPDFVKGVRISLSEINFEILSQCFGSGIAALVGINVVGALFAKAPSLLGLVALLAGVMFPNWVAGTYIRVQEQMKNFSARGRGEPVIASDSNTRQSVTKERQSATKERQNIVKGKYSYFVSENGKKRWYRTGNPTFQRKKAST